jgi:3-oxoacyl-[acyl-carrier-protein] synthase II
MLTRPGSESVVVTAATSISGLGIGRAAFEDALFDGRSAIGSITAFDTAGRRAHTGGVLPDFAPARVIPPARLRRVDRIGRLAVVSCHLLLADAGLPAGDPLRERAGVVLGSTTAGLHSVVDYLDQLNAHGAGGASAMDFSNTVGNAAASLCSIECGLRGPNVTMNYKDVSSAAAMAYAATLVATGQTTAAVTGGVEDFESVYFTAHDHFNVLAWDDGHGEASRPFDRRRNGFVAGNGAFVAFVETASQARTRGAVPLAEIAGVGATASAAPMNEWPCESEGLERCMRDALDQAELDERDVAVVFASANSTRQLDRIEARALSNVFGPRGVPVVALKGAIGESGASAAAGVLAGIAAFTRGLVPPSVGTDQVDPDCDVDIATTARPLAGRVALVNSFASGGANYSIVIRA